jgi:hypothetical protein
MLAVAVLLKETVETYRKHFALLAGYAAWLLLPYAGLVLFSLPRSNRFLEILILACSVIQALLGLWLTAFIPLVAREIILKKEKISLLNLQNLAWKILPSLLFVAILEAAVILGGLIMLVVPAFIFWVWFALSQPSVIFDGKKGLAALTWSRELARGRFWPLAGRLLAGPILFGFGALAVSALLISLLAALTGTGLETLTSATPPLWADTISTIIEIFSLPLFLIYYTLLYLDLNPAAKKQISPEATN